MKTYTLLALSAASLLGCGYFRSLTSHRANVEDDPSIRFPAFFDRFPTQVGAQGESYQLTGDLLRAMSIAAEDYLPPSTPDTPCPSRRESQSYRVIQQQDIFFVYIYENHTYCGRQYPVRHSGARYAIRADGRILRRLIGDQPESPGGTPDTDEGKGVKAEPGVYPGIETLDLSHLDGSIPITSQPDAGIEQNAG
jgi:hypothetical protein